MTILTNSESSRCPLQRFPDFGRELRRPFEVHGICYDCAEFYGSGHGERGCDGWPETKPMFTADRGQLCCPDFNRLPDVAPGKPTGQVFPPSRMNGRKTPRQGAAETSECGDRTESKTRPAGKPAKLRLCACGEPLAAGRQLCNGCRQEHRRQTRRRYMRRYRVEPPSGLPQDRHRTPQATDRAKKTARSDPHRPPLQTSVLQRLCERLASNGRRTSTDNQGETDHEQPQAKSRTR